MIQEYVEKLMKCGFSPCEAYLTYHDFLRRYDFSHAELDDFIDHLQKEGLAPCG